MDSCHKFEESLAMSHKAEDLPLWEEAYHAAFPTMQTMINHRQDGDHQRQGIDRSIILRNSKQITVDEKIRGRNKKTGKVYNDIALEYWSVYYGKGRRNKVGWVAKDLLCDYIAYAIGPLGICYLLPVPQLRLAWAQNRNEWVKTYPRIAAKNTNYITVSVGVPAHVVMEAIGCAQIIKFTACEVEVA